MKEISSQMRVAYLDIEWSGASLLCWADTIDRTVEAAQAVLDYFEGDYNEPEEVTTLRAALK